MQFDYARKTLFQRKTFLSLPQAVRFVEITIKHTGQSIGTPYNVYHIQHKSMEDLLKAMEEGVPNKDRSEESHLIKPCKGFDIEYGSGKNPSIEEASTKKLLDSDRNTPYYHHYFYQKGIASVANV